MFLTYFNARHGTWFTHYLEEGSFTLRSDSQWFALRYWIRRLKSILHRMRSLHAAESKKGIKVFKANCKKVLKTCSFKKNKWSFSTRKWLLPFQANDLGQLSITAGGKIACSRQCCWHGVTCEMYCQEQSQNKVRSSSWSLCTRLDPLIWDTTETPYGLGLTCLHHCTFTCLVQLHDSNIWAFCWTCFPRMPNWIEHLKNLKLQQGTGGNPGLLLDIQRWRLWIQLGEEKFLIRFLWQQSHNGFQNRQGLYALLLLLQSASLPANFLCQASAAHQGHLDLKRLPMSPLRRYSNIYYVSFEEIQQYILCLFSGDSTIYIMSPLRRSNNIYIYICLLWGDQMKYYFEKP